MEYKNVKMLFETAAKMGKVPEGVTRLSERCFRWSNVAELVMPNSITSIGNGLYASLTFTSASFSVVTIVDLTFDSEFVDTT